MARLLIGITAGVGLVVDPSMARSAPASVPVTFTIQPHSIVTALLEIAVHQKFFEKVGIDAHTVTVTSGPAAVTAMASGSADVATNAPEVFLALADKHMSVKLITGQTAMLAVLVARPGLGVADAFPASVRALKGKKIGVTSLSSATQYTTIALLKAAGISPGDVTFVVVGANAPAALSNGIVDAAVVSGAQVEVTHAFGAKTVVDLRDAANCPPALASVCGISQIGMWALGDWVQKHPEGVLRVRQAIAMADAYVHDPANRSQVAAIFAQQLPPQSSPAARQEYVSKAIATVRAEFSKKDLGQWIVMDREAGVIKNNIPVADVYAAGTPETPQQVKELLPR